MIGSGCLPGQSEHHVRPTLMWEAVLESSIVTLNENDSHPHLRPQLGSIHQAFHELIIFKDKRGIYDN